MPLTPAPTEQELMEVLQLVLAKPALPDILRPMAAYEPIFQLVPGVSSSMSPRVQDAIARQGYWHIARSQVMQMAYQGGTPMHSGSHFLTNGKTLEATFAPVWVEPLEAAADTGAADDAGGFAEHYPDDSHDHIKKRRTELIGGARHAFLSAPAPGAEGLLGQQAPMSGTAEEEEEPDFLHYVREGFNGLGPGAATGVGLQAQAVAPEGATEPRASQSTPLSAGMQARMQEARRGREEMRAQLEPLAGGATKDSQPPRAGAREAPDGAKPRGAGDTPAKPAKASAKARATPTTAEPPTGPKAPSRAEASLFDRITAQMLEDDDAQQKKP